MIRNEENKLIKIVTQPPVFEIKTLEFCKGFFEKSNILTQFSENALRLPENSSLNTVLKVALLDFSYSTQIMLL